MNKKLYFTIAFRIILLTAIGFALTFVTPYIRDFFGDTIRTDPRECAFGVDTKYDWGVRHYWYSFCVSGLFILSLVDSIATVINKIDEN
jgi:hypothetical protein